MRYRQQHVHFLNEAEGKNTGKKKSVLKGTERQNMYVGTI